MQGTNIAQDNRLTSARYELSLLEKRIMYFIIIEVRNQFVLETNGQKDLFNDLIVKIKAKNLLDSAGGNKARDIKKALKQLRLRSFEYNNGLEEDHPDHKWFEVGFINYGDWEKGNVEVQLSKKILPFLVELTKSFTEYSLTVAISLKSKWSQRMYEICSQWKNSGGVNLPVKELRRMFALENKYQKYFGFKTKVIDVAHKELKELYMAGQCDLYFEYSELKEGRSVDTLRLKIISRDSQKYVEASVEDALYFIRTECKRIFETDTKPKNKNFIDAVMQNLILEPPLLKHCYEKIQYTLKNKPKADHQKYLRAVFKKEYI